MIGRMFHHWRATALVVLLLAVWAHGNHTGRIACQHGYQQERIETQEQLFRLAEETDRKEALRLAAETERENLAQQLEDAAYAEASSNDCGLPASRVLRLNDR